MSSELTALLGAMPDITTVVDADGRIIALHSGDSRHDLAPAELVGRHLSELLPDEAWRATQPVLERALATGRPQELRHAFERHGRTLYLTSRAQVFGDPPRVLWHTRDVTDERALQDRLLQIQRFEGTALFASTIAHDFSNLLTGILGNAEFASAEIPVGSAAADALSDVISAARRAAELCHQLLGLSGKRRFSLSFVNLSQLCEEMLVILRTSVDRRIDVVRELAEPEAMPILIGDDIQLRQIILNLLSHASDAIGATDGTIIARTGAVAAHDERDAGWAYLEIEHDGARLDERVRQRLLEPFHPAPFGAGELGLAATFAIVRAHGGAVVIDDGRRGGTRVRVSFPLEREPDAQPTDRSADEGAPVATLGRGGLVLVVSADVELLGACRRALELAGHRMQRINSVAEALIAVRAIAGLMRGVVIDGALGAEVTRLLTLIDEVAPAVSRVVVRDAMPGPALEPDALAALIARL